MGVFHYPRINVLGLLQINVGTANNDDYSGNVFLPGTPYAPGQPPVRLADSVNVQPETYGMSDADWMTWAITPLTVANPPQKKKTVLNKGEGVGVTQADANPQIIPGEWNFYGDMGLTMIGVNVTGITDDPNKPLLPAALKNSLLNGVLSFNNRPDNTGRSTGVITDVNPEDSNSSQMFADYLSMAFNGAFLLSGKPTKGIIRWVNFQRNINLNGPNGAAATFQMCVPLLGLQGQPILQGLPPTSPEGAPLKGIVFRYTLYRPLQAINKYNYAPNSVWIKKMTELYATQGLNPDYCQLQGTIAPWFEGEPESCPAGRLLIQPVTGGTIPLPPGSIGNDIGKGPVFNLCPAVAYINTQTSTLSIDFSATFPDQYSGTPAYDPNETDNNPKWNFGTLFLRLSYEGKVAYEKFISYQDSAAYDYEGWVFDFPINLTNPAIQNCLENGVITIESERYGILLQESPYFILSDQSSLYAEQDASQAPNSQFRNDGPDLVTTSFQVYKRGKLLTAADPERFTLYYYDTTPNQKWADVPPTLLMSNYQAGQPISIPVSTPGNRLITAVLSTDPPPAAQYSAFNSTISPLITIRILPTKNYGQYYQPRQSPTDPLVGNELLTFDVIYNEVLRNYYLLYPAMSLRVPLNDPEQWTDVDMARRLKAHISLPNWNKLLAMPRTRDLSQSRRDLLTAWCNKIIQNP